MKPENKNRFRFMNRLFSRFRTSSRVEISAPINPKVGEEARSLLTLEYTKEQSYKARKDRAISDKKTVYEDTGKYYYYVQGIKLELINDENAYTYKDVPSFKLINPAVKNVGDGRFSKVEFTKGEQILEEYNKLCKNIKKDKSYKEIIAFDAALDRVCELTGLDIVTVDALDTGKGFLPNSSPLNGKCLFTVLNADDCTEETHTAILKVIKAWNKVPKEAKGEEAQKVDLTKLFPQELPDQRDSSTRSEPGIEPLYMNMVGRESQLVSANPSPRAANSDTADTVIVNIADIAEALYSQGVRAIEIGSHSIGVIEIEGRYVFNLPEDESLEQIFRMVNAGGSNINVNINGINSSFASMNIPEVQRAINAVLSGLPAAITDRDNAPLLDATQPPVDTERSANITEQLANTTEQPVANTDMDGETLRQMTAPSMFMESHTPSHQQGATISSNATGHDQSGASINIRSRTSGKDSQSFSYRVHTFFEKVKEGSTEPCNIQKTFKGEEYMFLSTFIIKGEESYTETQPHHEDIADDITFRDLKDDLRYEDCVNNYDKQFSGTKESLSFHSDEISELMDAAKAYLVTEQGIDIDLKQNFKQADNTLVPLQGNILIAYLEGMQDVLTQPGKEISLTQSGQFPITLNSGNISTILDQAKIGLDKHKDNYKLENLVTECRQHTNYRHSRSSV